MKDIVLGVGVGLAIVLSLFALSTNSVVREVVREQVPAGGIFAGPEVLSTAFFKEGVTFNGQRYATTSTATSYTLTTTELGREKGKRHLVTWTPNINTTLTSMASSSAPLSGLGIGETYETYFYNASTTAAATVTFAAGTGVDLQEDEGGSVIVNGLELAKLTFLKKSDTDVVLLVEPYQVGD